MDDLIKRCVGLLDGSEPEAWPVPIAKADLRALLDVVGVEFPADETPQESAPKC